MTITIRINGQPETVKAATVQDILDGQGIGADTKGVAVALNAQVVPRSQWLQKPVKDGDEIDIVHARQGG